MSGIHAPRDWETVNLNLVAKAIGELTYEQVLTPMEREGSWELSIGSALYRFRAWKTVWDYVRVDPGSLRRFDAAGQETKVAADVFFIDGQAQLQVSDITLANFLEELYRTLRADLVLREKQRHQVAADWLALSDGELQALLEGHPKILLNKGRMGWGAEDMRVYAPESRQGFPLRWLALRRERASMSLAPGLEEGDLWRESLGPRRFEQLRERMAAAALTLDEYLLMPVHPWQWDEVVQIHFVQDLCSRDIVDLGICGGDFRPQTSLRTLSAADGSQRFQLKLALSILNTSSVRGIDGRLIAIAPEIAETLKGLTREDPILSRTLVLAEVSGVFYQHRSYAQISEAPYRYHEFLGAIWRESPESLMDEGERSILTASLFHRTEEGRPLLDRIVEASGWSLERWLEAYFETIVVPLYHLQIKYGIGLVAHGQNIMLGMRGNRPSRLIIKDFQGDLRLLDQDIPELAIFSPRVKARLTRLPRHYLIHDLYTAHCVTVLRFVSALLYEHKGFPEERFYALLHRSLSDYEAAHPEWQERFAVASMLKPTMPRVLVNKVRFHIGYGDYAARPLPMLGTDLRNPLYAPLEACDGQ